MTARALTALLAVVTAATLATHASATSIDTYCVKVLGYDFCTPPPPA